ncbi:hypothetical protein TNIN_195241 [Trichonephila inaurata madagascariensis]|uniref:Uncharacterized protein n=1 Tax=Trichonephila inaurata madagascariensis TaxID=2747483 RepID=A0A8X6XU25_9ARAC|nr:hypothetical protein TNIN_195241 [Trichonephila inaurata madagascariensis]
MMHRIILIHENQQPLLRILWKESPEDPVKTFEMKTVTYGTVSAPFLATRTLLQLSSLLKCDQCDKVSTQNSIFNDPSTDSPTETLLRLLPPLSGQVRSSSPPVHSTPERPNDEPVQRPHSTVQSETATGSVYKGQ